MPVIDTPNGGAVNTDFIVRVSEIMNFGPAYGFKVYFTNGTDIIFHDENKDTMIDSQSRFIHDWVKTVNHGWRQEQ